MRKRTPSEIKAYGDGYAEAYKQFQYLIEKHEISTAVRKMQIFADAVALTVEVSTDTADTPQNEETCERCIYVKGSQWCQGCNGTPKRRDGEKVVDTPQNERGE